MSEQPTIGKIEQLTTNDHVSVWDIFDEYRNLAGRDKPADVETAKFIAMMQAVASLRAELESETRWAKHYSDEADALRAENTRLREALAVYANHDGWQQAPSDFGNVPSDPYDWFMCDGNGWETAEAALAYETTTAV